MKRGHRFQVTIIGQGAPVVCVRAANGDEAERVAAECLGLPVRRVIAARVCTTPRAAGRFRKARQS
jgi:hypothetical protein